MFFCILAWDYFNTFARRPLFVFIKVAAIGPRSRSGIAAWYLGCQWNRQFPFLAAFEVSPIKHQFPAQNFVGVYIPGGFHLFEPFVPWLQPGRKADDGQRQRPMAPENLL